MSLISFSQQLIGFREEIQFVALRRLYQSSECNRRVLVKELGISLADINFCFLALVGEGRAKTQDFSQSKNKLCNAFLFASVRGNEKAMLAAEFQKRKMAECEVLQVERRFGS